MTGGNGMAVQPSISRKACSPYVNSGVSVEPDVELNWMVTMEAASAGVNSAITHAPVMKGRHPLSVMVPFSIMIPAIQTRQLSLR